MSNVHDKLTKTFLADGIEKVIATWHGRKVFREIKYNRIVTEALTKTNLVEYEKTPVQRKKKFF